jgi:Na+/melibiose symporter-like transporter
VDVPGQLALIVGLSTLVFGLIEGQTYGWWKATREFGLLGWPEGSISPVAVSFAIAAVSLVSFVLIERARGRAGKLVVVDLRLFSIGSFSIGNVAALIVALGEFGLLFALPLFLQGALGLSALSTGAALVPLALGTLVAGGITPQLAPRVGPRGVVQIGLTLEVIGIVGIGLMLDPGGSAWRLVPWLTAYGVGVGFATAQLTGVILTEVPVEASGQGSGIQSTFRQVGSALGIAILGTILISTLGSGVRERLADIPGLPPAQAAAIAEGVRASGGSAIVPLRARPGNEQVVKAASDALAASTRKAAFAAAAFVMVGLFCTAGLPNPRGGAVARDDDDSEVATAPV